MTTSIKHMRGSMVVVQPNYLGSKSVFIAISGCHFVLKRCRDENPCMLQPRISLRRNQITPKRNKPT